jgi:hypothetical protein
MTEPGWPDDWADRMAGKGCPMCATLGKGDNDFAVEVFTGEVADVYLDRRSRRPGYRDDPAPGGPIVWQDIFSPDPVPDAELHAQATDLRALLHR